MKESVKGMATCVVCGRDFPLIEENHYIAKDPKRQGAIHDVLGGDRVAWYDAFDCPHCGCQNIMQERKPLVQTEDLCPCDYGICDECDHVGKTEEFEGCDTCKFAGCTCEEEPCKSCKHNHFGGEHPDYYTKKESEDNE